MSFIGPLYARKMVAETKASVVLSVQPISCRGCLSVLSAKHMFYLSCLHSQAVQRGFLYDS